MEIVSYVKLIIRTATHLSPSTTPVKGEAKRKVSLRLFSDPNKTGIFDHGMGIEDIDGDVEIVDPPNRP